MLGHSLKDAGTTKNLAVLVTSDSVSEDAISELEVGFPFRKDNWLQLTG